MKVLSNSPGLVDFAIGLVNSVLNLPNWLVKVLGNSNYRRTVINSAHQKFLPLFIIATGAKWVLNIAQLVEHCSTNAEAMGSNPVEVPKFFFTLICNCLNYNYHCDDHMYVWTS